ncbi:hypothetical protein [Salinibacterium sp.]|uniref:hypothetical protein n=1 Tax=Salinibacterium sp. TaxID=1915057 RepID=UPI00286C55BA|nr:hypothetical protein [Salinibacterium sp.]
MTTRRGQLVPSEDELRDFLSYDATPHNSIDTTQVISRSRRRRLPRQIAAGAVSALAVAGIVTVAVQTTQFTSPAAVTSQGAPADGTTDETMPAEGFLDTGLKRAPAEKINLCTGALAEVSPSLYGLQLDVTFPPTAPVGTDPITGTVRLTNTSDTQVSGYTPPTPALTLSQDGMVLWHSNGPVITSLAIVDLAPGASMEYQAAFTPVRCAVDDDTEPSFREGLPAVPAGQYELSAVIDFTADPGMIQPGTPELDLVTGPLSTITLG